MAARNLGNNLVASDPGSTGLFDGLGGVSDKPPCGLGSDQSTGTTAGAAKPPSLNSATLVSLALELIFAICSELYMDDLKNLRLTCKALGEGLASPVLRHISVLEKGSAFSERLEHLSQSNSAVVHCRQITIGPLNVEKIDYGSPGGTVLKALASLKGVETVIWHTKNNDPKWLQEDIWDAILGLGPNLLHLSIDAENLKVPLNNIGTLNRLESINLLCFYGDVPLSSFSAVSNLYSSSVTLKSITIQSLGRLLPYPSLDQLFSSSTNTSRPRSLCHLDITNCFISLDKLTLPHFVNLTSFSFSNAIPSPDSKYSPDSIWTVLKESGIHLEELDAGDHTTAPTLIKYLSSFSGLRKLRMHLTGSVATVGRFWSAAFPNHINTLKDFALYSGEEGEWCLSESDRPLIVRYFTKLKRLRLSVLCFSEDGRSLPCDMILESTKTMLDMAVMELPCLEHLCLEAACPNGFPCPSFWIMRFDFETWICEWIPTFEPPASCRFLPRLSVGDRDNRSNFVGVRNHDMKWVYETNRNIGS